MINLIIFEYKIKNKYLIYYLILALKKRLCEMIFRESNKFSAFLFCIHSILKKMRKGIKKSQDK